MHCTLLIHAAPEAKWGDEIITRGPTCAEHLPKTHAHGPSEAQKSRRTRGQIQQNGGSTNGQEIDRAANQQHNTAQNRVSNCPGGQRISPRSSSHAAILPLCRKVSNTRPWISGETDSRLFGRNGRGRTAFDLLLTNWQMDERSKQAKRNRNPPHYVIGLRFVVEITSHPCPEERSNLV